MTEPGPRAEHSRPIDLNWNLTPCAWNDRDHRAQRRAHELLSRTPGDWDGDDAGRSRILLLTSGLGLGHVRAAQAIEAAVSDAATVHTLDLWSLMHAGVAQAVHATYLEPRAELSAAV